VTDFSLPVVVLGLPLLGALFILFVRGDDRVVSKNSRHVALLIALCTFGLSFAALFARRIAPDSHVDWQVGIDALSMIFVLLISFLTVLSVAVVRRHISFCVREFCCLALIAESFMLTAVCAQNAFRFFVFWESAAFPLFLMTAVWGVEKRVYTAYKFCFSDLAGAVCLLPVLLALAERAGAADFGALAAARPENQAWLAAGMLGMLAFKAPLFPFHAWLSDTQAEAPVPTGILLCGVFSKLAFYAYIRLALPAAGTGPAQWAPCLTAWAVFSAFYGALITLKQTEAKKMAGFAHLAQVGFLAAGVFAITPQTLRGVLFLCVAQGLAVSIYLMAAGALTVRFKNAGVRNPTGIMTSLPYLGTAFFLSCLAVLAVPPLMPFTGQFLIFIDIFRQSAGAAFFLLFSVVLLYASFFKLFTRLLFGEPSVTPYPLPDMSWREKVATVFCGAVFAALSVMPQGLFDLAGMAVGKGN